MTTGRLSANLAGRGPAANPLFCPEAALRRLGGDRALLRELMQYFLEDSLEMLARIDAAVSAGSADELQQAAHGLRGMAASFDAHPTMGAAFRLEEMGHNRDLAAAPEAARDLRAETDRLRLGLQDYLAGGA